MPEYKSRFSVCSSTTHGENRENTHYIMREYKPTIGLEVHTELKTKTKMFCSCLNDPNEKHPNVNVCPVCLGHPGTLPTINKQAVEMVLQLGLALGSKIPKRSKFDRKNYFYPDLPKGYQISQYDEPLVIAGELNGVRITRIHLEEDTGRLLHENKSGPSTGSGEQASLVDFNRAGVPLMELVTEPDIKSGQEAMKFARELQLILRHLGISDADMEKGQMRVEVNISLMPANKDTNNANISEISGQIGENSRDILGTKVELKNLNSFRVVGEAIDYEIKRQAEILEKEDSVKQETRGWDEAKKKTFSQRIKEQAHDYRYFPEPDLPPLDLTPSAGIFNLKELKVSIPELPEQKRERFEKEYGLGPALSEILIEDRKIAQYFEEAASEYYTVISKGGFGGFGTLFNYLVSDLKGLMNQKGISINELKIKPEDFAELIAMIDNGKLSSRLAKDILKEMFLTGVDPCKIVEQKGLKQVSDTGELKEIIEKVIKENPKAVADFKKGKGNALKFLTGQVMAASRGQADPHGTAEILKQTLKVGKLSNKTLDKNHKKDYN